jgi:hypothetical protein
VFFSLQIFGEKSLNSSIFNMKLLNLLIFVNFLPILLPFRLFIFKSRRCCFSGRQGEGLRQEAGEPEEARPRQHEDDDEGRPRDERHERRTIRKIPTVSSYIIDHGQTSAYGTKPGPSFQL